ncbi:MAG: hypothetical protein LBL33_03835 [Tannerella sp.]|nr:hypothetical protein [Tannerella sp.]
MKPVSKIITAILLTAVCSIHLFVQSNIIDLSVVSPTTSGTGWTYNHVYTIANGADVTVIGDDVNDYRRIVIEANATAMLTLDNATINTPSTDYGQGAIMLDTNATLTLNLVGTNSVTGADSWPAIAWQPQFNFSGFSINNRYPIRHRVIFF